MTITALHLPVRRSSSHLLGSVALGKTWAAVVSAGSGDTSSVTHSPQMFSFMQGI